jgi:subtilisin family serine protease
MKSLKVSLNLGVILSFLLLNISPALAIIPNDKYTKQWGYTDVNIYDAWNSATGSRDVVVAVIDNGFDTFHSDLKKNAWKNAGEIPNNKIDDDKNGYVDDVWGWNFLDNNNNPRPDVKNLSDRDRENQTFHHATIVAGIIGAVGNNNHLGVGINWEVSLMNLKVLGNNGNGGIPPLAEAIYYAVDNGADVLNISLVGSASEGLDTAIKYAFDKNVAIFAAAGNNNFYLNKSEMYPVCADASQDEEWILGVSAIDETHHLARFSNSGSNCIDITAPGVSVSSTLRFSPTNGLKERYSGGWNGTSFATPFVSGAAALIKSIRPEWTPTQIYHAIMSTAHHTPGQNETNYANYYGSGLIQIDKAVEFALGSAPSSHAIENLALLDVGNGNLLNFNINDKKENYNLVSNISDFGNIVAYKKEGETNYVSVVKSSQKQSSVIFYNNDWSVEKKWYVDSSGELDIKIGDVDITPGLEIILAPKYEDDRVFVVYDLDGNMLGEHSFSGIHHGVSLGLVDSSGGAQDIIAIARFGDNENITLFKFDIDYKNKIEKEIHVPYLHNIGSVSAGDIDGDGVQEYVVGAGEGDVPFVIMFKQNGRKIKNFFAYGFEHTKGLDIVVGDYNGDGQDDIVTYAKGTKKSIKIWNNEPRKIGGWDFITEDLNIDFPRLLAIFK